MSQDKEAVVFTAYDDWEEFDPVRPEKNLLFAVLLSAMNDLRREGDSQRKATEFFLSRDDEYLFSFRAICDYLKLDPKQVLYIAGLEKFKA